MTFTLALAAAASILTLQPGVTPAPAQPASPAAPADKASPAHPAKTTAPSPFASDKAEEVAKGYGFTEGPTWVPGQGGKPGFFIFCDMRSNKVYRYDNGSDKPAVLRDPSSGAVGSAADSAGTVYNVDTATRSISAWSIGADGKAGAARTVADKIGGEQLGGMNDITVAKDGTLYVSHGSWFLPRGSKSPFSGVLRITKDGAASKAADGLEGPNGVTLSPDGKTLYATEYGPARIYAFPINADGTLGERKLFADLKAMAKEQSITKGGGADGIRCDKEGNVFSTGPGGIWVLSPAGGFVGHLAQSGTNLAFGGQDGKTLLITTGGGVVKVGTNTPGAGW